MTAKEITIQNIENFGLTKGKSIKGKGLELFTYPEYVSSLYYSSTKEVETLKKELENMTDKVFIKSARTLDKDGNKKRYNFDNNFQLSLETLNVEEIIDSNFKGFEFISFKKIPVFVGYVSVSNYTSSLESQTELIKNLLSLDGKEIADDEFDEYDTKCLSFDHRDTCGDYTIKWGSSSAYAESTDDCVYVDGRLSPCHNSVLDDFWDFENDFDDYYKELDPNETVAVYHRKGKDWYVGYALEQEQYTIAYKRDDYNYNIDDYEEEEWELLTYSPNQDLINTIEQHLKGTVSWLEIKSYIYNEMDILDNYGSNSYSYNDNIFNIKILDNLFEDKYDAANRILDFVNFTNHTDEKASVLDAYDSFLAKNIKDDVLLEKYTHLKKLKELVLEDGKELVYTKIGDFTEDMAYAIRFKNEEYHFSLSELFNSYPKKFYKDIAQKLSKRLMEKYENSILMQNAKYVFVGLEDSFKSGNCKSGTNLWTTKFGINTDKIGGIRGDEILKIDFSNFTKRAVIQAIANRKKAV